MSQTEEWKDIPGLEGFYQASNLGRIRSLARIGKYGFSTRPIKERILVQTVCKQTQYYMVGTFVDRRRSRTVHSLVAAAFLGERPKGLVIDHIDGDRKNNHVENLRYVTQKENLRSGRKTLLNEGIAQEIRGLRGQMSQEKIAKRFGIGPTTVSNIMTGVRW